MSSVIYRLDDLACFQPIYTSHELEPSTLEQCVCQCISEPEWTSAISYNEPPVESSDLDVPRLRQPRLEAVVAYDVDDRAHDIGGVARDAVQEGLQPTCDKDSSTRGLTGAYLGRSAARVTGLVTSTHTL